jgi:MoaA/NifB/PqqE/SkfB family radical SAM enzyme
MRRRSRRRLHVTPRARDAKNPIVSFGQGCEGEPLIRDRLLEEAIINIRSRTGKGTINLNTNGSSPAVLSRLFNAGLDTVRISLNSAREEYYSRYYRPNGYSFRDVMKSIYLSKKIGGFVSLNYLTMPGFTDSRDEIDSITALIAKYRVDMIQWRNLNYDPLLYFKVLKMPAPGTGGMMGIKTFSGIKDGIL